MMLPKPDSCKPCVLYQDGLGYVPDLIMPGAEVTILAQNPGDNEEKGKRVIGYHGRNAVIEPCDPQPLIGATGYELEQTYLPIAGLSREQVSLCNVLKCRWIKNGKRTNELPPADILGPAVSHCTQEHLRIAPESRVVVAFGDEAWDFTQSPEYVGEDYSLTNWRGFIGPKRLLERPVYAVYHLAAILRQKAWRTTARLDWKRLGKYLAGKWPLPVPDRLIVDADSKLADMVSAFERARCSKAVSIDLEYVPDERLLRIAGLGWRNCDGTIEGIQIEWLNSGISSYVRRVFVQQLVKLIRTTPVVSQNFKDAEGPTLLKMFGIKPQDYFKVWDTMQMHACLWSEMQHTLAFIASIMGEYPKMKHLEKLDELLYNWGDVIETLVAFEKLLVELKQDTLAATVYHEQSMPVIPILMKRELKGIRTNQPFIEEMIPRYEERQQTAQEMAEAYCGFPINLGSPEQVHRFLSKFEGMDIKSCDDDDISLWREKFAPFDSTEEQKNEITPDYITRRIDIEGAHPLLEARAMYAKAKQILSHYLIPLRGAERCFPSINIHTQATGRHSTTNPPLATLPSRLRSIVLPDKDTCWISGDYDQQELRIFAAEAHDEAFLEAFRNKWDIHTLNCCDLFTLPLPPNLCDPHDSLECAGWRSAVNWGLGAESYKDDVRRVFSKRYVFRLVYFADPRLAHTIPGAMALGIDSAAINAASMRFIGKHPAIAAYKRKVEQIADTTCTIYTWAGRRRTCLKGRTEAIRALGNHPMQGGGADLLNKLIIQVDRDIVEASYVFGMHDSFNFECLQGPAVSDVARRIKAIAEQPRRIGGMDTPFPVSLKIIDETGAVTKWKETV